MGFNSYMYFEKLISEELRQLHYFNTMQGTSAYFDEERAELISQFWPVLALIGATMSCKEMQLIDSSITILFDKGSAW